MQVIGNINGKEVPLKARAPDQYGIEMDKSKTGAYATRIIATDEYGNIGVGGDTVFASEEWIEPVWQRTQRDVERVTYLNRKISDGGGLYALSSEEQREWLVGLVGCLNYYDMNRIEIDTKWLSNMLHAYGYGPGSLQHKTDWVDTEFPYAAQMERIRSNIVKLTEYYHRQSTALPGSIENPGYMDINNVERVLLEMKEMIGRMEKSFRYCGTFFSGQEIVF